MENYEAAWKALKLSIINSRDLNAKTLRRLMDMMFICEAEYNIGKITDTIKYEK